MHQLWHVRTLEMWSTVTRWSQAAASQLDPRCSLAAIKATSWLAAASSPATTETQPHQSGTRGCPSVSVSHRSQRHTYAYPEVNRALILTLFCIVIIFSTVEKDAWQYFCDFFPCLSAEKYEPCRNPGAASTSVQSSEKAFYQAGEMLTFSCHSGYELHGVATIYCIPGHPSQWNSTPPACRGKPCPHTAANFSVIFLQFSQQFGNTMRPRPYYVLSILLLFVNAKTLYLLCA